MSTGISEPTDSDSLAVIAFRMGAMERAVANLSDKFDGVQQNYITTAALMLILNPLKDRIAELENANKEHEKRKSNEQSQFRLAITVAILSPAFTIIVNLLMVGTNK